MTKYSVKQLAKMAGISVRTLHHYDRIGLLNPSFRSEKGYRYYGKAELLKLQQILFYKELDFSLQEIGEIVNNPDFDLQEALQFHKNALQQRLGRLKQLLVTLDKTIDELENRKEDLMKDQDIYKGFENQDIEAMRQEVRDRWGNKALTDTEARIRAMGLEGWDDHKQKTEEVNLLLADLMDCAPDHRHVQKAIAMHHKLLNHFYEVTEERYRGLGKMYTEDARFTAHYEQYRAGLAVFIHQAIEVYCDNGMTVAE